MMFKVNLFNEMKKKTCEIRSSEPFSAFFRILNTYYWYLKPILIIIKCYFFSGPLAFLLIWFKPSATTSVLTPTNSSRRPASTSTPTGPAWVETPLHRPTTHKSVPTVGHSIVSHFKGRSSTIVSHFKGWILRLGGLDSKKNGDRPIIVLIFLRNCLVRSFESSSF